MIRGDLRELGVQNRWGSSLFGACVLLNVACSFLSRGPQKQQGLLLLYQGLDFNKFRLDVRIPARLQWKSILGLGC